MERLVFDADTSILDGKVIAVIGYGNQGRAQARALRRFTRARVIIGNIRDYAWERAARDGFEVFSIREAAEQADIVAVLIPDEVAPQVFSREIAPAIEGKEHVVVDFASGYNVALGFIEPPPNADVVMVAPRMIGAGIEELVSQGRGYPVLIGVAQDASGRAWDYAKALAKGIGALQPGGVAVVSSFEEEALLDLFTEQFVAPHIIAVVMTAFEVLTKEFGVSPEAAILELYASGEWSRIFRDMAEIGFFEQLKLHSTTSQYGQLTRAAKLLSDEGLRRRAREAARYIAEGWFAREWMLERASGYPVFKSLWRRFRRSDLARAEERLFRALKRR